MNDIIDKVYVEWGPSAPVRLSDKRKLLMVQYFRFVDRLSHDDAMRKTDELERYLEKNS